MRSELWVCDLMMYVYFVSSFTKLLCIYVFGLRAPLDEKIVEPNAAVFNLHLRRIAIDVSQLTHLQSTLTVWLVFNITSVHKPFPKSLESVGNNCRVLFSCARFITCVHYWIPLWGLGNPIQPTDGLRGVHQTFVPFQHP